MFFAKVSIYFRRGFRAGILGLFSLLALSLAKAGEPAPNEAHLLFSEACVRETKDQAWTLRIRGQVPSLAGCYVLVHDAEGHLILKTHIPHGDYTGDHPLDLTVPKDGQAGDYRIIVVGREADIRGLSLPLTELQLEVYGRTLFATRMPGPWWFLAESDGLEFSGTSGEVRILREGKLATKPLEPGKLYTLDIAKTFYFKATPGVYLSLSSGSSFIPKTSLSSIPWWQLTGEDRANSSTSKKTPLQAGADSGESN